eukprot:319802_1
MSQSIPSLDYQLNQGAIIIALQHWTRTEHNECMIILPHELQCIEYELDTEIENCEIEISSGNNLNDENNNNINGIALVECIIIVCGIVFALILMLCVVYCCLSYKK